MARWRQDARKQGGAAIVLDPTDKRDEKPAQPVWRRLAVPFAPAELLNAEQVERIHQASLDILETLGLEFQNEAALDILAAAGADVDRGSGLVRFDRHLVLDCIAKAPASFTLFARNPARNLTLGGANINFACVSGPPNVSDLDRGRRPGTYRDQCDLIRLEQALDALHLGAGVPVEAIDLPAETRHLDGYHAFLTLTDRLFNARAIGRARIADAIDMVCIARGTDRARIAREPSLLTVVNVNSPRRVDREMLAGLMEMASNGQATIVTPFTLAGAMSPITLAGALTQQNAEALGVIAFAQMVRPGAPVIYGGFTSNVDMKTGAPAFGTPEYARAVIAGGQLARRYRLPYRASNVNASNAVDAQAAYESQMSLWACVLGHVNLVYHGAGWLEGGLTASYEKMVLDAEMCHLMAEMLAPSDRPAPMLTPLPAPISPGKASSFFPTGLGHADATIRANHLWKRLLAEYREPPMDPSVRERLDAFVARRKAEIAQNGLV